MQKSRLRFYGCRLDPAMVEECRKRGIKYSSLLRGLLRNYLKDQYGIVYSKTATNEVN